MTTHNVVTATRAFVVDTFLYARRDYQFGVDDSLLGRGIVDSMGVIELVDFVHTTFGVEVANDEITEENFGTLAAIATFVATKQLVSVSSEAA